LLRIGNNFRQPLELEPEITIEGIMPNKARGDFRARSPSAKFVVILHGWWDSTESMEMLDRAVGQHLPDADSYVPDLPIHRFLSRTRASGLVASLFTEVERRIEARQAQGRGYQEIILVGHSFGAVLARALWLRAHGAPSDGTLQAGPARPWAHRVTRLILLAGASRGWDPHSPVSAKIRVWSWFGDMIENVAGSGFLLLDIRRGAAFLTTMRLQTLAIHYKLLAGRQELPVTVNILGTYDNLVAPADNIDLATDNESCHYLEVPNSGHEGVLRLEDPQNREARSEAFRVGLVGAKQDLLNSSFAVSRAAVREMGQEAQNEPGPQAFVASPDKAADIRTVIFIVHGIRDYGFWTRRLARTLKERATGARHTVHTITSSYGFFPMGPFLAPGGRRKRVGWFRDQYVTACAQYPNAEFHFVGHSNGTYLLAAALKDCPGIRFGRVVLAGSVISRRYDWRPLLSCNRGQVQRVLNYVATEDWVVATIPKGLQDLRLSDLGDAGHSGFADTDGVVQVRYVPGSHSAALDSSRWGEIAEFVLDGRDPVTTAAHARTAGPALAGHQQPWLRWVSRAAWIIPPAVAAMIVGGAFLLLAPLGGWVTAWHVTMPGWGWALALLAYVWIASRIVTRL
jgi:alpha-beta hydrolase superfamily lysophospholipase